MKFVSLFLVVVMAFLLSHVSIASEVTDPLATSDFFTQVWALIGQGKGASGLGLAVLITQAFMLFFRTEMASFAGKWKLTIVTGLSVAVGIMALKTSGAEWAAAIFNSVTLTAIQVFIHQLVKQLKEKDQKPAPLKAA